MSAHALHSTKSLCRLVLFCLLFIPATVSSVIADDQYRTPLAGEPFVTTVLGERVDLARRDRANTLALSLGSSLYLPSVAGTDGLPIAALYWRKETERYRSRLITSVLYNDWSVAAKTGNGLELLGQLETYTNPFAQQEILQGKSVKSTSAYWGFADAWLGLGYRMPVAPFQSDNDLRLQLFYTGGYHYYDRSGDTGANVTLPSSTWINGLRARARYDGIRRNIMELPHSGFAVGADLEYAYRTNWSDSRYGDLVFKKDATREFLKVSGYAMGVLPVPFMTEKDRLLLSAYGGTAPHRNLDRFSGFRIGGGPFPYESDDLWRVPYPGAVFNQFVAADYVVGTAEYRRELFFFLYLHLRGTIAWINRDFQSSHTISFTQDRGEALSVGITTGMPWNSSLYMEYSRDFGILRNGATGSGLLLLWSKAF